MHRYYKNIVILTDFNCGMANAQVELKFKNIFRYAVGHLEESERLRLDIPWSDWAENERPEEPPYVVSIHNIPFGNIDYAAYGLYSCYRSLGKGMRPNIFVHVTDPGVGAGNDRSLLITDEDNVFIGPNNGSLGLMVQYFRERRIPYSLFPLDQQLLEQMEQERTASPSYVMPMTFHGRDFMAVVAGLVAGGVQPRYFELKTAGKFVSQINHFAEKNAKLPEKIGQEEICCVFKDNTFGNLKSNISVDPISFSTLVDEEAVFEVQKTGKKNAETLQFRTGHVFADMKKNQPLMYIGSTFSPIWDERFVELAVNMGSAAKALKCGEKHGAESLTIKRIQ
jgi:S-adenosylmethionine hydrolase